MSSASSSRPAADLLFSMARDGSSFQKLSQALKHYGQQPVLLLMRKGSTYFGGFADRGFEDHAGRFSEASYGARIFSVDAKSGRLSIFCPSSGATGGGTNFTYLNAKS